MRIWPWWQTSSIRSWDSAWNSHVLLTILPGNDIAKDHLWNIYHLIGRWFLKYPNVFKELSLHSNLFRLCIGFDINIYNSYDPSPVCHWNIRMVFIYVKKPENLQNWILYESCIPPMHAWKFTSYETWLTICNSTYFASFFPTSLHI